MSPEIPPVIETHRIPGWRGHMTGRAAGAAGDDASRSGIRPCGSSLAARTAARNPAGARPRRRPARPRPSGHDERRQGGATDLPTLVGLDLQPEVSHRARRDRPEFPLETGPRGAEGEFLSDVLSIGPPPI